MCHENDRLPLAGPRIRRSIRRGQKGETATDQTRELLTRFDTELRQVGLSLDNTVRTRTLRGGPAIAATKEVLSVSGCCPVGQGHQAPVTYPLSTSTPMPRYPSTCSPCGRKPDCREVLQGVRSAPPPAALPDLRLNAGAVGRHRRSPHAVRPLDDILPRIEGSLTDAGCSWDDAVHVAFFLHRSEKLEDLRRLFVAASVGADPRDGVRLRRRLLHHRQVHRDRNDSQAA